MFFSNPTNQPKGSFIIKVLRSLSASTIGFVLLTTLCVSDGNAATKLNDLLVTDGAVFSGFSVSAGSSRVVYLADQDADNVVEIYSVQFALSPPAVVSVPTLSGWGIVSLIAGLAFAAFLKARRLKLS